MGVLTIKIDMFNLILMSLVVFSFSFLSANTQQSAVSIPNATKMLKSTLQDSIHYNQIVIDSMQRVHNPESMEKEISNFRLLRQKWEQEMIKSRDFIDYLKQSNLSTEQIPDYYTIMSQYRLKSLKQISTIMHEKDRLDTNCFYGISDKKKQDIGYIAYIAHRFKNKILENQDTLDRIGEYTLKTKKIANAFLNRLRLITNTATAKQYTPELPNLLKNLHENNEIINLYLNDDFDGVKEIAPSLINEFYCTNSDFVDEIERIKQNNYYNDSSLQEFIISLGYPLIRVLSQPRTHSQSSLYPQ